MNRAAQNSTAGPDPGRSPHLAFREPEVHCWYAATREEALRKGQYLHGHYGAFLNHSKVIELGCGEGAFLLWLQQNTDKEVLGVDSNAYLCALGRSFGGNLEEADLLEYLRRNKNTPAVYLYLDVVEHVPFDVNYQVLQGIPAGSRLILQTPYTRSLKGHEFYMNVPSHIAPYSPWVIARLLERTGFQICKEGSVEGHHPPTWKNLLRAWFIRKVLGIDPEMLLGGGNYFVVADKFKNAS